MALYEFVEDGIQPIQKSSFAERGIHESDIQRLLRDQIEVISDRTMVVAEEFGYWEASRRRIDLLCIDKEANLVVVELKRTEDGGYMDLQAIRYSAMISTMTFDQVVEAHKSFLSDKNRDEDARQKLLEFLGWNDPDEESFAQDVRIVLASADFSTELTSTVLWLNDKGMDIRCVKMEPYFDGQRILLDIQQVIPLPEAEQFQVRVRQKKQKEYQSRTSSRDISKFTLRVKERDYPAMNKRKLMLQLVREIIEDGVKPKDLMDDEELMKKVYGKNLFIRFAGKLDEEQFAAELMESDTGGKIPKTGRFFCKQDELFWVDGMTYALTSQWGLETEKVVDELALKYPRLEISLEKE